MCFTLKGTWIATLSANDNRTNDAACTSFIQYLRPRPGVSEIERLARCIEDPRSPARVDHTLVEMIRFRALLIAAGYADTDDCVALRTDPAFKMAAERSPETADPL